MHENQPTFILLITLCVSVQVSALYSNTNLSKTLCSIAVFKLIYNTVCTNQVIKN